MRYYGITGSSEQMTWEDLGSPVSPWVEMNGERPEPHFVATETGEWVEPEDTREYKHFTGQAKLDLFTEEEQAAIIGAAYSGDIEVAMIYERFKIADYLTYSDPKVEVGLSLLVSKEKLTEERKSEIIAVMTAEREGER